MKISAQEEYGLRCLVQLARAGAGADGSTTLSTREISENEGLTLDYTAQILAGLRRMGFVKAVRGAHGGFHLTQEPSQLTVGELFRYFDGSLSDGICDSFTGKRDTCMHASACNVAPVWNELSRRIYGFLDGITLADIVSGDVETGPQVVPLGALRRRSTD